MSALIVAGPSLAGEGVDAEPGLWRTTSAVRLEVSGEVAARTETRDACIADGVLEPMALFNEKAGCDWDNLEVVGDAMTFDLVCSEAGEALRGPASFTLTSGHGAGQVRLKGEIEGRPVSMTVDMRSERAGGC